MRSLYVQKLHELATIPYYASPGASGLDLSAVEDVVIEPWMYKVVRTGIAILLEEGYEAQVRPRSGLAAKHGISLVNSPGTIDSDYRGEILPILMNNSNIPFEIHPGDRIAQLVICSVTKVTGVFEKVVDVNTARGTGGFGSTGR